MSVASNRATRIAPDNSEPTPGGDGIFGGTADTATLVRFAQRAAAPGAGRVMAGHDGAP